MSKTAGKIAVLIDHASFSRMAPALGIGTFNYGALHNLLVNTIGDGRAVHGEIIITVATNIFDSKLKAMRTAGFSPTKIHSRSGADDQHLIGKIKQLPTDLGAIIIVSNDQDFVAPLTTKLEKGVEHIFWVGTRKEEPGRGRSLSPNLDTVFDRPDFTFVELADHAETITRTPYVHVRDRKIEILLSVTLSHENTMELWQDVAALIAKYPSMGMKFEGKA